MPSKSLQGKEKDVAVVDATSDLVANELRYCSPERKKQRKKGIVADTCLTEKEIRDVAKWYNARVRKSTEPLIKGTVVSILDELHRRLGTTHGEEYAWINCGVVPTTSEIGARLKQAFRPMMPRSWIANDRTWLSNFDIEKVMSQYEEATSDFWMVGVFPMDFAHVLDDGRCVSMEMCGLSVREMRTRGKTQAGIVLNLDKHDQDGSHWVACYIDILPTSPNYGFFYYDSVAKPAPPEVADFAFKIKKEKEREDDGAHKKQQRAFRFAQNTERRQFQNTECGIFTMFFLVCCLSRDIDFETICREMGNDDDLHTLRSIFFRPPASSSCI